MRTGARRVAENIAAEERVRNPVATVRQTTDELAAKLVDRYGPRRRMQLTIRDVSGFPIRMSSAHELGPRGGYVMREHVRTTIDIPAHLALPEHRGIVDRLLGRHPGPLRELGAFVKVPLELVVEMDIRDV